MSQSVCDLQPAPPPPRSADASPDRAMLCVLASGSGGNSSVLLLSSAGVTRVCLIDLGLSPRATFRLLDSLGLRPDHIDDALLTHLDSDHIHPGWRKALPRHTRLHLHRAHARLARSLGLRGVGDHLGLQAKLCVYDQPFPLAQGVVVNPIVLAHDDQGVVAFRFDIADSDPASPSGALGFATDLGHVTPDLISHFQGVNVLAIESNYCPQRQLSSARPDYLKRRIMGGSGHLSNEQSLDAIRAIQPSEHVVLLHLSRDCNCRDQVRQLHDGADYALTIASQYEPTRWIRIAPSLACPVLRRQALSSAALAKAASHQLPLFGSSLP